VDSRGTGARLARVVVATVAVIAAVGATAGPSLADSARSAIGGFRHEPRCEAALVLDANRLSVAAGGGAILGTSIVIRHGSGREVRLSVTGLPSDVSAVLAPAILTGSGRATVALTAGAHAQLGHSRPSVTVSCADHTSAARFDLEVTRPRETKTLTVEPREADAVPGRTVEFCVRVPTDRSRARRYTRSGAESTSVVVRGLPRGVRAVSSDRPDPNGCILLSVRVASSVAAGDYSFTVVTGQQGAEPATVTLHVRPGQGKPFTISGDLSEPLAPGTTLPLDLTFTNPNPVPVTLTALAVSISRLDDAHTAACPIAANYVVTPFRGDLPTIVLPANGHATLSSLGIDRALWPQVGMLDTDFVQNGCLGAKLTLAYTGTATSL